MRDFLLILVISTLDLRTGAFSTCEKLQSAPHSFVSFSGEKDNLSYENCGEWTDSTSSQFPWDVTIYSEQEYCFAPGILVSPRAVLFDMKACNFGTDVQEMKESIKLLLSSTSSQSNSPSVKPTRIDISDDKLLGLLIVRSSLNNATMPKRPICLYNLGSADDQKAEFLTTSTSKDGKKVDVKSTLSNNCHTLAKTTTDCDALNSNSFMCLKLNGGLQSSKLGFITRRVGNRYFLRSKLDEIPSLRHNNQNLFTALDLMPYFKWIGNKAPDLRILSQELTFVPAKVYSNGAESYKACGRAVFRLPELIRQAPKKRHIRQIQPFITRGEEAEAGAHPWHALLVFHFYNHKLSATLSRCGGSLLSPRAILTAAHCLVSGESILDPDEITVVVGAHSRGNGAEANRQTAEPSAVLIHPGYNGSGKYFDNDLALLIFDEPFKLNSKVKPVCLWNKNSSLDQIVDDENVYTMLAGWGLDENQTSPDVLQEAFMPVVSYEKCFQLDPQFYKLHLKPGVNFCAGDVKNQTIACNGDSGGGLMAYDPKRRRWFIRGVVSFGKVRKLSENAEAICDSTRYPLFADVAFYLPWIVANVPDISFLA